MYWPVLIYLVGFGVALFLTVRYPMGGSWVKRDGTIIEWDGDGHGRIVHPDGEVEEH